MKIPKPIYYGTLIQRYKRFLADVKLDGGDVVTAHCANTGSMSQVSETGSRVVISRAKTTSRKTKYDWQLIEVHGQWAGINTATPNRLLVEGFESGVVPEFNGYDTIRTEVAYGERSRVDAVLSGPGGELYVEAKNVTLVDNDGCALFPDAVTSRGAKHLDELVKMADAGHHAAMFFLSQRMDAVCMGVAAHIDPLYAEKLRFAVSRGVAVISWVANVTEEEVTLGKPLPFRLPDKG